MTLTRLAAFAAFAWLSASSAMAQDFPARPVRVIIPFAAGNGADLMVRTIADGLSQVWKQSVVVENRPGANGIVAAQEFIKSAPDGYTYFVGDVGSIAVNPSLFKKLPYDPKDMVPLTDVMRAPWVLFTSKAGGITSLADLVARAKAQPGRLTYGSTGPGAPNFLAAELLKMRADIDMLQVPYRDGTQLHTDAAAGQINLMISSWATAQPVIDRMQPLAVAAQSRHPNFPHVPTVSEATGLTDFEIQAWAVFMGRRGTPQAILDKVQKDAVAVIQQAEVQKRANSIGIEVKGRNPDEIARLIDAETERYRAIIVKTGIQRD